MDKSHYQQIQALIEQNDTISGFDLYYLGFFSHFVPRFTLQDIFTHIANIISLHSDQLINNEEKIEFLIRMLSKKIDRNLMKTLLPQSGDADNEAMRFLNEYFSQILKIIPKYTNISKFELFYLGHFHAICPSYRIAELFHHINNINQLVTEDLIDEETQVDFLLKILNKKIMSSNVEETALNIPQEGLSPFRPQDNRPMSAASPQPRTETQETAAFRQEGESRNGIPMRSQSDKRGESEKGVSNREEGEEEKNPFKETNQTMQDKAQAEQQDNHSDVSKGENKRQNDMELEGDGKEGQNEDDGDNDQSIIARILNRNKLNMSQKSHEQEPQPAKEKIVKMFSFQNSAASGEERNIWRGNGSQEVNQGMEEDQAEDNEDKEQKEVEFNEVRRDEERNSERFEGEGENEGDVNDEDKGRANDNMEEEGREDVEEERGSVEYHSPSRNDLVIQDTGIMRAPVDVEDDNEERGEERQQQQQIMEVQSEEEKDVNEEEAENERKPSNIESIEEEEKPHEENVEGNVQEEHDIASEGQEKGLDRGDDDDHARPTELQEKHPSDLHISQVENENPLRAPPSSQMDGGITTSQLMAQLYPENSEPRSKGTLEDILNNLLESEPSQKQPSQPNDRTDPIINATQESSLIAGLTKGVVPQSQDNNNAANAGQAEEPQFAVPYRKDQKPAQYQASLEVLEEEPKTVNKPSGLSTTEEEKQHIENTMDSEVRNTDTQEDLTSMTSQSQHDNFQFAASQASRPDASLILKWKNVNQVAQPSQFSEENSHPFRDLVLQQVVNHIQPSMLAEPIQTKQEDSEVQILEANTMVDPTLDDAHDHGLETMTPMVARTLNDKDFEQVDPSLRACETAKQTLSPINRETVEEDVSIADPSQSEGPGASTLSQNRHFHELYGTQNSKISSSPRRPPTSFEEEKLGGGNKKSTLEENKQEVVVLEDKEAEQEENNRPRNQDMEVEERKQETRQSEEKNKAISNEEILGEEEDMEETKVNGHTDKNGPNITASMMEDIDNMDNDQPAQEEVITPPQIIELSKCAICTEDLADKPTTVIEKCDHKYHRECLKEHLARKIAEKNLPIICPRQECKHSLLLVDLMDLVDTEIQEKYIINSLKAHIEMNADVCCCPTPGCSFAFLKTYRTSRFRCSLCKHTYCMSCHTEWHKGMSCGDYQATQKHEANGEENLAGKKMKQCSDCKLWVGKKVGANNMECRCGKNFCYECGKGPQGCFCGQNESKVPIVQPDLFHRAMQSPQEYRTYSNNKGENGKTVTSETFTTGGVLGDGVHSYKPSASQQQEMSVAGRGNGVMDGKERERDRDRNRKGHEDAGNNSRKSPERERRRRDKSGSRSRSRSKEKEGRFCSGGF